MKPKESSDHPFHFIFWSTPWGYKWVSKKRRCSFSFVNIRIMLTMKYLYWHNNVRPAKQVSLQRNSICMSLKMCKITKWNEKLEFIYFTIVRDIFSNFMLCLSLVPGVRMQKWGAPCCIHPLTVFPTCLCACAILTIWTTGTD